MTVGGRRAARSHPSDGATVGARGTRRRSTREDSVLAGVLSGVSTGLLVLVLALAVALAVVPRLMGGASLTVLSGSMEPAYSPGDVVVVRPVTAAEVQVGDVVTFQPVSDDPTLVTHRVVTKQLGGVEGGTLFVTRGDANSTLDDPIVPEQIMGEVVYHVPLVGHASVWVGEHVRTLTALVAGALLVYAVAMFVRPSPGRRVAA